MVFGLKLQFTFLPKLLMGTYHMICYPLKFFNGILKIN